MSYVYHAMSAYFDRDNVALPGLASYFRAASEEERGHAQTLMDFQVWSLLLKLFVAVNHPSPSVQSYVTVSPQAPDQSMLVSKRYQL